MSRRKAGDGEAPERLRFTASLPGGPEGPLWKLSVEALSTPEMGGERLKLRAHIETNFASVARPALARLAQRWAASPAGPVLQALQAPRSSSMPAPLAAVLRPLTPVAAQARGWVQRRLQQAGPLLSRVTDPLLSHDLATWFEMELSNAPLVAGAQALLPHADKLAALGIQPQTGPNATPVQAWQGRIGDEVAQVSLLRLDDRQMPENLRRQLKGKPFQVAAALVNVAKRRR